jgi:hypothetical protein
MCIALTGNNSDFLIFTAATSNILTVSTLSLLTHKISLLTKAVRKFVITAHQLSEATSILSSPIAMKPTRETEFIFKFVHFRCVVDKF